MKKSKLHSSLFGSVPAVPTTISGHWLVFSHMANHYKRLIHVKPRVNTANHNNKIPTPRLKRKPTDLYSQNHGHSSLQTIDAKSDLALQQKVNSFLKEIEAEANALAVAGRRNSKEMPAEVVEIPSRHAKCFMPYLKGKTDKNNKKKTSNNRKTETAYLEPGEHERTTVSRDKSSRNSRSISKLLRFKSRPREHSPSANSYSSIGTVYGSEDIELLADDNQSSKQHKAYVNNELFRNYPNSHTTKETNKTVHSIIASAAAGTMKRESSHEIEDSGCGSHFTTRESTPEKPKHNKPVTTTSQDRKSISVQEPDYWTNNEDQFIANLVPQESANRSSSIKPNFNSEYSYINFLTEITEQVLKQGIYTNKRLKALFKAQLNKYKDSNKLEMDKLELMLEQLRIDIGIPKEDLLDATEFGYGSINYSIGPFYTQQGSAKDDSNQHHKLRSLSNAIRPDDFRRSFEASNSEVNSKTPSSSSDSASSSSNSSSSYSQAAAAGTNKSHKSRRHSKHYVIE